MKTITIKKGHILQSKGDKKGLVYRVKEGLLRSYTVDEKGKEHIFMFASQGWIVSDATGFSNNCELFIDALENSVIEVVESKNEEEKPSSELLINRITVLQKRVIMLMSWTAVERYKHFIKTYPEIMQRVTQKMVASYLGITPEALSKVKSEMLRAK
ncbi:MAG: Crp/Fnr family transcriptional regulator [Flavobacteriaceae bacterium]|nr:Crp/Fnr family transcriptional regulator [Flavobacteriaceae bacterium]